MKEKLPGNNRNYVRKQKGFSTIELVIALALISIVLAGAVGGNYTGQYWTQVGRTANEGLYKTKAILEDLRGSTKENFYSVVSMPSTASTDPTDPVDNSCISGGFCYFVESNITDVSSCSKTVEAKVKWQIPNYPQTSTSLFTNLTNSQEIIDRGGDCLIYVPNGNWETVSPQSVGLESSTPGKQFTSIDTLNNKIYVGANTYPSFMIYETPINIGINPTPLGSFDLKLNSFSLKINAVDVIQDLSTKRTYAFVAVATTTNQVAVFDVTDSNNPILKIQLTLRNVNPAGSFPQGYKLYAYGQRMYVTTRETSGNEFHIFNISNPALPIEIGNGFELNRTVNEIIVRDQKIAGVTRRLVFLASDSNLKELGVLDVTNDIISEINSVNLPGIHDGLSIGLVGNKLYFGRQSNPTGPELYVFDISNPNTSIPTDGMGEVGRNVTDIEVSGNYAFIGTNRISEEFQVWNSDYSTWNTSILNSGRFSYISFASLAPLGFDIDKDWIYGVSNSLASDKLQILYATP